MTARRAAAGLAALGVVILLAVIALLIVAIWTVGPNSERLGGTAFVLFIVGGVSLAVGLITWSEL